MPSKEQDAVAERLSGKYGAARVSAPHADGSVLIVGMSDDIEREFIRVEEDGTEHPQCAPAPAEETPHIKAIPAARRKAAPLAPITGGIKVIAGTAVTIVADAEAAARQILTARKNGETNVRLKGMIGGARERDLTVWETEEVIAAATRQVDRSWEAARVS